MVYFLSVDGAKLYVFSESTPILKGVFLEMNVFFLKIPPLLILQLLFLLLLLVHFFSHLFNQTFHLDIMVVIVPE